MASWLRAVSEGGSSSESGGGGSESSSADDKTAAGDNDNPSSSSGGGNNGGLFEYFGWVYHLGVNSIGHEYCHLRFMYIRGNYVKMYKRDPHENPGIKPIRRGTIGHTLMVEELGRRKVNNGDLYVLRFYNRLDERGKGEIACATAGEARKWMEAFDHAKQQAEYELSKAGSPRSMLQMENEIDLEGRRPRVRRYAHGLKRLIRIGQGPEKLLHRSSSLGSSSHSYLYFHGDGGDAVETHEWKCVRTMNGVRILEDVASSERGRDVLVKAVGVVNASADTVFDVVLSLDKHRRYEWDTLTSDLELVDSLNGHYDVVYGVFDPRHLSGWQSKRDFVFSRQWFHGQDGTYTILQFPAVHKKCPPKPGYHRTKISPSTWEIRNLNNSPSSSSASASSNNVSSCRKRCIVTQTLEMHAKGWLRWKHNNSSKLEKTVPFALLTQVAGLKEYMEASPSCTFDSPKTVVQSKVSDFSAVSTEFEDKDATDEFYDAISTDSLSEDDESENEKDVNKKDGKIKLKNVAWAIAGLTTKKSSEPDANQDLNMSVSPIDINLCHFAGTMRRGEEEADTNCWTSPNGSGFKIRGKTYLKDNAKVKGGEPLLKLIAVDWFKVENCVNNFALHPKCLVQSESGKRIPFILVVNLQIPAKPNYSLIMYYAADRPVNEGSLLGKFIDGSDMFRDSRFKLIPSIVEGYWMVKRAVGTKACLLGKAVPCKYLRQDNFLEIDIDIGSSSVARSVTGLVLGYVTSIVVDLAILVEAKEEDELPEHILGTVRLNRVRLDSAVDLDDGA